MPPVKRRYKLKPGSGRKPRRIVAKRKPKNYNKRLNNFQRGSRNMLQIRTLIPKEIVVDIQYRTQLIFDTMGYSSATGHGATGTIIRINLNNPTQGTGFSSGVNNLVDVVSLGGTFVDPVFTRTNGSQLNLSSELDEYFSQYRKAVVVASNSKVRIAAIPNQKEVSQFFTNVDAQGTQGDAYPYNTNHMPYLSVSDPTADGDMYVWSVKQKTINNLTTGTLPDFHKLRTAVPGMKMKNLRAYKDGHVSPGVLSSVGHTPRKTWAIKDWRDNLNECGFNVSTGTRSNEQKSAYHYVGICNTHTPLIGDKPARVKADIVINYKCRFVDRNNDPEGGDDPLPQPVHQADL